jgi:hypothetical protein
MGFIYFLQSSKSGYIKIGYSADVRSRFLNLQRSNPEELVLLGVMEGSLADEKLLHEVFGPWRWRGEWYRDCPEIHHFISKNTDEELRPDLRLVRRSGKRVV